MTKRVTKCVEKFLLYRWTINTQAYPHVTKNIRLYLTDEQYALHKLNLK